MHFLSVDNVGPQLESAAQLVETIEHSDPIGPVLFAIIVVLVAAKLGGHLMESLGQPSVLGELLIGVVLGNLSLLGFHGLDFLKVDYMHHQSIDLMDSRHLAGVTIDHIARIGVILLLFHVGLGTSVAKMRRVGGSALSVAIIGVVVPTGLGWASGSILLPDHHWAVHMFLGATLAATSVGITARTLQDLGRIKTTEAQIILGAAVIDDVLGLVVLAVAEGVVASLAAVGRGVTTQFGAVDVGLIFAKAFGFLMAALVLGQFVAARLFKVATALRGRGLLLVAALLVCFGLSWVADAVGLATIVGAFAAGLILDNVHYAPDSSPVRRTIQDQVEPLVELMVPIFFVVMGLHVDLRSFSDPSILGLASTLIIAAILGKQACALGVLDKTAKRLVVGLGMIPRGEVGLIFAAIGLQLHIGTERVVDEGTYSALVLMVIVTTMVTPPLLKWGFGRDENEREDSTSVD